MKLVGKWRILVKSDGKVAELFPWERKGFNYLVERLFAGEKVADAALDRYGLEVRELSDADEVITVPESD